MEPLLIHVGANEILLDDSMRLAKRAKDAGVAAELKIWPDMPHIFQAFRILPEARQSLSEIATFLTRHLGADRKKAALQHKPQAAD